MIVMGKPSESGGFAHHDHGRVSRAAATREVERLFPRDHRTSFRVITEPGPEPTRDHAEKVCDTPYEAAERA